MSAIFSSYYVSFILCIVLPILLIIFFALKPYKDLGSRLSTMFYTVLALCFLVMPLSFVKLPVFIPQDGYVIQPKTTEFAASGDLHFLNYETLVFLKQTYKDNGTINYIDGTPAYTYDYSMEIENDKPKAGKLYNLLESAKDYGISSHLDTDDGIYYVKTAYIFNQYAKKEMAKRLEYYIENYGIHDKSDLAKFLEKEKERLSEKYAVKFTYQVRVY